MHNTIIIYIVNLIRNINNQRLHVNVKGDKLIKFRIWKDHLDVDSSSDSASASNGHNQRTYCTDMDLFVHILTHHSSLIFKLEPQLSHRSF